MEAILDLFRQSYVFKVVFGVISFLVTLQLNDGFQKESTEIKTYQTDISFESKFLQAEAFDYYGL